MKGREREKKKIFPIRSYLTQARAFRKKEIVKKLKKYHSTFISSQTRSGQAEKEKKQISFRSIPNRPGLEHSQKKLAKKFKKLRNIILTLFLVKSAGTREKKKKKSFWSVSTRTGLEHSQKKNKKIKNIIRALFLSEPCWDKSRKRKKKIILIRSYLTRARAFPK